MQPGLHPLQCSRCGAPLDPTNRAKGEVVTCEHCGQPHLWIAPGRVEPQGAVTAPASPSSSAAPKLLLALAAIVVVVFALGITGAYMARGARGGSLYTTITSDMPIAMGDELHMQIDNHSCDVRVQAVLDDGRLFGVPCQAVDAGPIDRQRLGGENFGDRATFRHLDPGDIVLAKNGGAWARRSVIGLDAGKRVRVRPLLPGKDGEQSVPQSEVIRLQKAQGSSGFFAVPLPDSAPLEPNDVLWMDQGTMRVAVRVDETRTADIVVSSGYVSDPTAGFVTDGKPAITRRRSALLVDALAARDAVRPGSVVLFKDGTSWVRREVVEDSKTWLRVKAPASASEETRAKENLLIVRR